MQSDEVVNSTTPSTSTHHTSPDETCVKVTVVFQGYPKDLLDKEQANVIEEYLHKKMLGTVGYMPVFSSCEYFEGTLRFECSDQHTTDWLKKAVMDIKVGDKSLTVYHTDFRFSVFIPGTQISFEEFRTFVSRQNTGLNPDQWFLTKKIDTETGQNIFFEVDCDSAIRLEAMNFKIKCGLRVVTLEKINS